MRDGYCYRESEHDTSEIDQLVDCDLQQAERTALNRKIFETKLVRNKGTKF